MAAAKVRLEAERKKKKAAAAKVKAAEQERARLEAERKEKEAAAAKVKAERIYATGTLAEKRYRELDLHAALCPLSRTMSQKDLVRYLLAGCNRSTEEEKLRALHAWVCINIKYNIV